MTIQEQLQDDLKQAMRDRDKARVAVIRVARDALQKAQLEAAKQRYEYAARQVEQQHMNDPATRDAELAKIAADYHDPLSAEEQEAVIAKEVKRRHDTAAVYRKAGQEERAAEEEAEAHILETYLPKQLDEDELRPQVAAVIAELGIDDPSAMGKLMPVLMQRFRRQADGRLLSQIARELLNA